jgi:hypothetical protein
MKSMSSREVEEGTQLNSPCHGWESILPNLGMGREKE